MVMDLLQLLTNLSRPRKSITPIPKLIITLSKATHHDLRRNRKLPTLSQIIQRHSNRPGKSSALPETGITLAQ